METKCGLFVGFFLCTFTFPLNSSVCVSHFITIFTSYPIPTFESHLPIIPIAIHSFASHSPDCRSFITPDINTRSLLQIGELQLHRSINPSDLKILPHPHSRSPGGHPIDMSVLKTRVPVHAVAIRTVTLIRIPTLNEGQEVRPSYQFAQVHISMTYMFHRSR
jgi:hypothetical protein